MGLKKGDVELKWSTTGSIVESPVEDLTSLTAFND